MPAPSTSTSFGRAAVCAIAGLARPLSPAASAAELLSKARRDAPAPVAKAGTSPGRWSFGMVGFLLAQHGSVGRSVVRPEAGRDVFITTCRPGQLRRIA